MPAAQLSIPPVAAILLTTFAAPVHTVPNGEEQSLSIRATNYTAGNVAVTLWLAPAGAAAADQYLRCKDLVLAAKETKDLEIALPCPPGTRVYIAASAATSISASIVGTRQSLA